MSCRIPKSDLETMQRQGCFYAANGAVYCGEIKDPVNYIMAEQGMLHSTVPPTLKPQPQQQKPVKMQKQVSDTMDSELASHYVSMSDSYKQKTNVVEGFKDDSTQKKEGISQRLKALYQP
jgi:hypothetical protein